ncbi:Uncharacterised protein [Bordetella pertussis]|nr:Uncharacterised protein [Bordetella pertussis]CPI89907.1 Uncharacterised protein [Bordetella pertussis]CPO34546.1 Uncharacterised protein [Bordetella pertussis]CPP04434.1 Uncharacterised protein [Bordetella pertussis]
MANGTPFFRLLASSSTSSSVRLSICALLPVVLYTFSR